MSDPTDQRDERVTSGVLASESTTGSLLRRHRRRLVGGATLGLLVALASVGGVTLVQSQANERAVHDAEVADAEATFATAVVDVAEGYEPAALQVRVDAPVLGAALEDHLAVSDRSTAELEETVARTTTSLRGLADALEAQGTVVEPTPDPLVDEEVAADVLTGLAVLRAEGTALVDELRATADLAARWSRAVVGVDAALAAHAATVDAKQDSEDPATLAEGWRSELEPLASLEDVATEAADVPGLADWAGAHVTYARSTTAFIDQATSLLDAGELDQYNTLFLETFGTQDPFGFEAAARAGAAAALGQDPVVTADALSQRAAIVLDALTRLETTIADELGDDRA